MKILLYASPSYGFGDVIYCAKLYNYMKEWFPKDKIYVATTQLDKTETLLTTKNIYEIKVNIDDDGRYFLNEDKIGVYQKGKRVDLRPDVVFVTAGFANKKLETCVDIIHRGLYTERDKIFFLSEYNDILGKFDINTGIGGDRLGLFLTKKRKGKRMRVLKNPYAYAYIASTSADDRADECMLSFINMCSEKYKYKKFDIVIPDWNGKVSEFSTKKMSSYYKTIRLITAEKHVIYMRGAERHSGGGEYKSKKPEEPVLTFREDVPIQKWKNIHKLLIHSVGDVLTTGDQSLADCISWVPNKNIWYQTMEWKQSLARALNKYMPNKYIGKYRTTCGGLKCIKFKSNGYKKLIKDWDFRKLGKERIKKLITGEIKNRRKYK